MSITNIAKTYFPILLIIMLLSACQDNSPSFATDFTDVPPLPDTTSAVSSTVTQSGVTVYVVEEGNPQSLDLTIRDNVFAYYSVRVASTGEIIQSSYANGVTAAIRISNIGSQSVINNLGGNLTNAILGMKEGERRVLLFPESANTYPGDEDLIVDFELETIIF